MVFNFVVNTLHLFTLFSKIFGEKILIEIYVKQFLL